MSMQIYLKLSFREALLDVLKVELADDQAPLNPVVVRTSQPDDMLCALDAEMAADAITANLDRSYACGRAFATKVAMSNSEEMLVSVADMEMFAAWANHRYVTLRTQALQAAGVSVTRGDAQELGPLMGLDQLITSDEATPESQTTAPDSPVAVDVEVAMDERCASAAQLTIELVMLLANLPRVDQDT